MVDSSLREFLYTGDLPSRCPIGYSKRNIFGLKKIFEFRYLSGREIEWSRISGLMGFEKNSFPPWRLLFRVVRGYVNQGEVFLSIAHAGEIGEDFVGENFNQELGGRNE